MDQEVMHMAKRKQQDEIICTFEFTEGAQDRITQAFVDTYYAIKAGIYKGPLLERERDETV